MTLLTLDAVAERLSVSASLVYKLARAAEYAAEVQAGKRRPDDVPPGLVRYLDAGFPVPKRIGKTVRRVRVEELERWLNQ
jgi:predicted DNA-binding transcriptional regulator AlpA